MRCRAAPPARNLTTMTTGQDLAQTATQSAIAKPAKPARELKVTGKVRVAIDAMVWQGLKRDDAAQHAGMKANSLYVALRRPDVKAHYLAELDVLRTSERARNIHAAVEVRDQTDNQTARIQAVKWLEESAETKRDSSGQRVTTPGVVVVVNSAPTRGAIESDMIEINPLGAGDQQSVE